MIEQRHCTNPACGKLLVRKADEAKARFARRQTCGVSCAGVVAHSKVATFWTGERVSQFRDLIASGFSYSKIAHLIGITKNAAIGKALRLGISAQHPNAAGPKTTTLRQRLDALDIFPPHNLCVFPMGHPGKEGFRFCCHPIEGESSYCEGHHKKTRISGSALKQMEAWKEASPARRLKASAVLKQIGMNRRGAA